MSRGGLSPSGRGLGVSPRFLFVPRSLAKRAGDTGGEGFEIISKWKREFRGEGRRGAVELLVGVGSFVQELDLGGGNVIRSSAGVCASPSHGEEGIESFSARQLKIH